MTSDLTVLVVAHRSQSTLPTCLQALAGQTRAPRAILVLENGSPADERIEPDSVGESVTFVSSQSNLGFAGGNNRLARMAETEWLALLNPDAYARPDWIEAFEAACRRYPEAVIFGSTQLVAGDPLVADGLGDCYHALGLAYRAGYGRRVESFPEGEVFAACGAAMFIRRDVFNELGGFDERFFCYNEDVDLSYRARLRGQAVVQLSDAIVEHVGYSSSGRRSEFATYHGVRNRLWVFVKNTPGWLFWALLPGHVSITLLLWVSAFRHRQGRTFGRALRDALVGLSKVLADRRDGRGACRVAPSTIARQMSWSPLDLFTRRAKVRPYRAQSSK